MDRVPTSIPIPLPAPTGNPELVDRTPQQVTVLVFVDYGAPPPDRLQRFYEFIRSPLVRNVVGPVLGNALICTGLPLMMPIPGVPALLVLIGLALFLVAKFP